MTELPPTNAKQLADFISAVRRRYVLVAAIAGGVVLLSVIVALVWTPAYRSTGTILIEAPDIPDDLVKSTVSSYADERLQVTQQRVMTTQNLITIIDKFNLFEQERKTKPLTLVAEDMRKRIGFENIGAEVTDPKSGRMRNATIAFSVWYDGNTPTIAQQVANELVTLYLSENLRTRQERATGSASFLSSESQKIYEQLKTLETKLANFKTQNAGSLPEQMEMNTQLLDRTQTQLLEVMRQMQGLRERQTSLQSQLNVTPRYASVAGEGGLQVNPQERLAALEAQYRALRTEYGEKHPNVVKVQAEIAALRGASGGSRSAPSNPAYVQIQAQLSVVDTDLEGLKAQEVSLQEKVTELEQRIVKAPEVEREYSSLKRDYDGLALQYETVRSKGGEAQLAQNLETERMGEKFSVIEPPMLPLSPIRPNRPAILLIGIFLGIVSGLGGAVLADMFGGKLYGVRQVAHVIGVEPIAVVPYVRSKAEARMDQRQVTMFAAGATAVALLGMVAYVHFFVTPLGVILATAVAR